jgi:hypothetical protein
MSQSGTAAKISRDVTQGWCRGLKATVNPLTEEKRLGGLRGRQLIRWSGRLGGGQLI